MAMVPGDGGITPSPDLITQFRHNAEAVSAVVRDVDSMAQALAYVVDLCAAKEACQPLFSGCREALSDKGRDLCNLGIWGKTIAAPGLGESDLKSLIELAAGRGISVIQDGMRGHLAGIDIGLTMADYGIAETGTLVLDCSNEDLSLATMVSEVHVAVLPASRIRPTAEALSTELKAVMGRQTSFLSLITGASRTADIERVLALGVHGPLELHILILSGA
jgi:L-lactate dehydrogenase complex protein LldG